MIEMDDIRRIYGTGSIEVHALRGVSLHIRQGEFVSIMGPSGSGKSTLMNIMGCLDTPSSGSYLLNGRSVQGLDHNELAEVRNRLIGFVFQNFDLLPYATAAQNVELPMIFKGTGPQKRRNRSRELLERVGLGERIHHRPTELSGGEMQRVAIARALANSPKIVLADEPTGNLDSASGDEIIKLFEELQSEGHTILLITHDSSIARRTERIIYLRDGLISDEENQRPPVDPVV